MKKLYFTVGPSKLYPNVEKYLLDAIREQIPSLNHRGEKFHSLFEETNNLLKKLLNIPNNYHIFFITSGTEAMELMIKNTVLQKSAHLITGSFGERFYEIAKELGKKPEKIYWDKLSSVSLEKAELLCVTQNDTSTGERIPMGEVYKLKRKYKNLLIAVDCVSSLPYENLNYKYLDGVFVSVQKGFGLPAGLGILILSPKALKKSQELLANKKSIGTYHNFPTLLNYYEKKETPETPNVLGIYLLNRVLKDMHAKGIGKIRQETEKKADFIYHYFQNQDNYSPAINDINLRSITTIVINVKNGSKMLLEYLKLKGLMVGSGYGANKDKQIRIGNFPAHSLQDFKNLVKIINEFNKSI